MSAPASFFWQWLGLISIETTVVIGLAAILHSRTEEPFWRRTIWQICLLALGVVLLLEICGWGRATVNWIGTHHPWIKSDSTFGQLLRADLQSLDPNYKVTEDFRAKVTAKLGTHRAKDTKDSGNRLAAAPIISNPVKLTERDTLAATGVEPENEQPNPSNRDAIPVRSNDKGARAILVSILVWFLGSFLLLGRSLLGRVTLHYRSQRPSPPNPLLQNRIQELAARLGLSRSVRVLVSRRFSAPVAFGLFRPTIGLPADFQATLSPAQQDAVLAHELAHLAACDPAWLCMADIISALLWWHPLVWSARRELRHSSETAADQASLLLSKGPAVLAECLVALGHQLAAQKNYVWLNVNGDGFRSGLGRRVERLLNLRTAKWNPPHRFRTAFVKALGPVVLVAVAIISTAWANPQLSGNDNMKTRIQSWRKSLAQFALFTAVSTTQTFSTQANATPSNLSPPNAPPPQAGDPAEPSITPASTPHQSASNSPANLNPVLAERYGLSQQSQPSAQPPPAQPDQTPERVAPSSPVQAKRGQPPPNRQSQTPEPRPFYMT